MCYRRICVCVFYVLNDMSRCCVKCYSAMICIVCVRMRTMHDA